MGKDVSANTAAVGQPVTYRICIYNGMNTARQITLVVDAFQPQWSYIGCSSSDAALQCADDGNIPVTVSWGPTYSIQPGTSLFLTVTGSYTVPGRWCNGPTNYYMQTDTGRINGSDNPCVTVN
jgi:hypothetical protein